MTCQMTCPQLVELDTCYVRWIELTHRMKKNFWDPAFITFGAYCAELKKAGFRII